MSEICFTDYPHNFYIPVMGTGFTIDSPLFVAKYGISSVISLVDDVLIEQMRKFWCKQTGEIYEEISSKSEDARARRITAYLNLLQKIVDKQIVEIRKAPFENGSEITKYFEMLPEHHKSKVMYREMLSASDQEKRLALQEQLRKCVVAGSIDVNIMTKLDKENYKDGVLLPYEYSDAASALRGYANSRVNSTIVLSAGFNPNLYGYIAKFADFLPDENFEIKKKVCLKVSDYRSAEVQGKYLAKHGIWVSEYRIESALNCGGHAFINDGQLLGPILSEFKRRKDTMVEALHGMYQKAMDNIKRICSIKPYRVSVTVQGGVGTSAEHDFLLKHYGVDAVGWGSPFLLVPEATNVDNTTIKRLIDAKEGDVFLSSSSPLGVPFWNLKNSISEEVRLQRIKEGNPGSYCPKGYLRFDREFTAKPICRASKEYQKLKLEELENNQELSSESMQELKQQVLSKSCICHELSGGVLLKYGIDSKIAPAICPGPNIINFKKIATLREMVDHIYGRYSLLANSSRLHMFTKELQLQLNNLLKEIKDISMGLPARSLQKLAEVKKNLLSGIEYYRDTAKSIFEDNEEKFLSILQEIHLEIEKIQIG